MSAYRREETDKAKCISFLIKDELLRNYNEIWEKVTNRTQKQQLDSEPVYNDKYLKAKIKYYNEKINPHFDSNEIPKKVLNLFVYQ